MRLTEARVGDCLLLRSLPADPKTEIQVRSLGLVPGAELRLVRRAPFRGPLLLEVGRRSVAVGWLVASNIEVVSIPASAKDG